MEAYRLQQDVPVVWATDLRKLRQSPPSSELSDAVRSAWGTLRAGTLLEMPSLTLETSLTQELGFARVRVDGRDGLVELDLLRDALPGWESDPVPSLAGSLA